MYDVIVIGGGPAGGNASERAAEKGLSVLLVEERFLGGVCLNEGCIPSKALLHCAKLYSQARDSMAFGVRTESVGFDWPVAMARKNGIVAKLRKASESTKKRRNIPVITDHATLLPSTNGIFRVKTGETVHEARHVVLCTGSEAVRLPLPGADQPFVYTNREMLDIDHIPRRLVVIGGGIIGLEFATLFSEIGSAVTVIEMLPTIAGALDDEIRSILQKQLEKKGITFELNAAVTGIEDHAVGYRDAQGQEKSIAADIVLVSAGRRPRTGGFGLESLHPVMNRAAIKTDEQGRTSVPNLFAAGDVNGVSMLAHTASREADVCIDTLTGVKNRVRYDRIPGVIYTHPEVATVGFTKPQALQQGIDAAEAVMPLSYSGRYLAETDNGRGTLKVVYEKQYGTILGVHMIGGECSEMIHGAVAMVEAELRIPDVRDMVFAHPTVAEIMREAVAGIDLHSNSK